jgi:vacuolar-type H+-ATPase subunit D/Vma8
MEKSEILEMAIRELTENAINKRKETLDDKEQQLYADVTALSSRAREIVRSLPQEQQKILSDYFEKTNLIADHECLHLYVQGAKDCVALLKQLGVL